MPPIPRIPRISGLGRSMSQRMGGATALTAQAARELGSQSEAGGLGSSVLSGLSRVGTWMGSLGFGVRNILMGNLEGAARNVGDFVTGAPTVGLFQPDFLRLSREKDLPETTDLLKFHGIPTPDSGLARFGINLVGGVLTDPISYITLGGSAALSKLGTAAASGSRTAIAKAFTNAATKAGRVALKARALQLAPNIARRSGFIATHAAKFGDDAARALTGRLATRAAASELGEQVIKTALGPRFGKIAGRFQTAAAKAGLGADDAIRVANQRALRVAGRALGKSAVRPAKAAGDLFRVPGIRLGLPFAEGKLVAATARSPLRALGKVTAPSLALRGLGKFAPKTASAIGKAATASSQWIKQSFNKFAGKVPGKLKDFARTMDSAKSARTTALGEKIVQLTGNLPDDVVKGATRSYFQMQDDIVALGDNVTQEIIDARFGKMIADLSREFPKSADDLTKSLTAMQADMKQVLKEMVDSGMLAGSSIPADVYLPMQFSDEVATVLKASGYNKATGESIRNAWKVFSEQRGSKSIEAFNETVRKIGEKLGVELPERVVSDDFRQLWMRRVSAHIGGHEERLFARRAFTRFGEKLGRDFVPKTADLTFREPEVGKYVSRILKPFAKRPLPQRALHEVNKVFKPMLTVGFAGVPNVAFHVRNAMSGVTQALMDPDLGFTGFKSLWNMTLDLPLMKNLGLTQTQAGRLVRALKNPGNAKYLDDVAKLKVGNYTGREFIELVKKHDIAGAFAKHEIIGAGAMTARGSVVKGFTAAVKAAKGARAKTAAGFKYLKQNGWASKMMEAVEDHMRINGFAELIGKGIDPLDAAKRIKRVFIDYAPQSGIDQVLRDIIPFSRFTTGTVPVVAKAALTRPATFLPVARAPRAAAAAVGKGTLIPEFIQEQTPIPTGLTDSEGNPIIVSSLGLIHEELGKFLNIATDPARVIRKSVLGATSPAIKTPLEIATNQNFFFGGKLTGHTRPPPWLKGLGLTKKNVTKSGTIRETVPGWVNAVLSALPVSRQLSTASKLLDERKAPALRMINVLTGIKVASADQRREMIRVLKAELDARRSAGDVGVFELYYTLAENDPELKAILDKFNLLRRGPGRAKGKK